MLTDQQLERVVGEAEPTGTWSSVSVIVPCLNEEEAIGPCVSALLALGVGEVIVVDGKSSDRTAKRAADAGARVLVESRRGYGRAIQTGIAAASTSSDVLLFVDGDGSDCLEHGPELLRIVQSRAADFAMGSRLRGPREPGSISLAQLAAGRMAGALIWLRYGTNFTDMSPFRAIRRDTLTNLGMQDTTFGWNLEMQMRVAAAGLKTREIAVGQRRRAGGTSKVSGDLTTAMKASWVIARTFARLAVALRSEDRKA